jgi:hypothetical protein
MGLFRMDFIRIIRINFDPGIGLLRQIEYAPRVGVHASDNIFHG